ncbi:SpoIID/LytB domain-containing protein [Cellulosimicrobium funkei]|nr:SpoIID/LytB domain-containing protein [Cellulosimicrobium funkei]
MSRMLHPVLKAGTATALALTITATTILPATAMPVVPGLTADPAVTTASSVSPTDPAVESGETASEVKGAEEQSIPLGGIDPLALPEVPDTPESSPAPDVTDAPDTPSPENTETRDSSETPDSTQTPSMTDAPDVAEPSGSSTPEVSESGAAASEAAETEVSLMSSTLSPLSTPVSGTTPSATGSETQPSDVVIQELRAKADSPAADAPAAPEAEVLTDSVFNGAISSTQEVEVERIATLTQPVETMDFIVAGVTWDIADAGQVTDVSLRVREAGEWTEWNSMEVHDGDEAPHAARVGTEPLISSGGDAIQVRVTTPDGEVPAGLELELIDPGTAETDGKLEAASTASADLAEIEQQAGLSSEESAQSAASSSAEPAGSSGTDQAATFAPAVHEQQGLITGTAQATATATNTSADAIKPRIITRAQWGADESKVKDWGTPSTDLQAMYVHHTAGSNNYTESGAYAQIRGIFQYHAVSLNWGDIGYQFLVDKYGNIFQGRRGSIEKPVQGAQAGGFNTDTIGISAMGNYDVASAPAPMVRAIEKVLAWQAYRYGVDPTSTVTLTQRGNASSARWSDGHRVSVPTILGHKVTNTTACPGRYLDAQLPTIRRNVDSAVDAARQKYDQAQPPSTVVAGKQEWTGDRLSIWWNKSARADYYKVFTRTAPVGSSSYSGWKYVGQVDGRYSSGSFAVSRGVKIQFAVRAYNDAGYTPLTVVATYTFAPPSTVVAGKQEWTGDRLSIWWNKSARADYYKVFTRTAPVGSSSYSGWKYVRQVDGRYSSGSFAVSRGVKTQFAVRAYNDAGYTPLTVAATYTFAPPSTVVAGKQEWTGDRLSIWWNKSARADYYKVFTRTAPVGSSSYSGWKYVRQVDGRYSSGSFTVSPGTKTQFAVRAYNDAGYTPLTVVATHTRPAPPAAVSPVKQQWTGGKLSVWWTKSARADYYKVFTRTAPVGSSSYSGWKYVRQVDGRYSSGSFAVGAGTKTQFAVRAYNDGGYSPLVTVATYTRSAAQTASFSVKGSGWGHGVGMSQYGARAMAAGGKSAEQIIGHYYGPAETRTSSLRAGNNVRVHVLSADSIMLEPSNTVRIHTAQGVKQTKEPVRLTVDPNNSRRVLATLGNGNKHAMETANVEWGGTRYWLSGPSGTLTIPQGDGGSKPLTLAHGRVVASVVSGKVNLITELRLNDEYLYGIAEMPSSWPAEALQAQAMASRSYALRQTTSVKAECDCHVWDEIRSQKFTGWAKESETTGGTRWGDRWVKAVDGTLTRNSSGTPTQAQSIWYGNSVADATYYSSSGGSTRDAADVWGNSVAYLTSKRDPYSISSAAGNPNASWVSTVSQATMARAFNLKDVVSVRFTTGNDQAIGRITGTSSQGETSTMTGTQFRSRTGIKSAWVNSVVSL